MQTQAQPVHEQHHRAGSSVYEAEDQAGFGILLFSNGLADNTRIRSVAHDQERTNCGNRQRIYPSTESVHRRTVWLSGVSRNHPIRLNLPTQKLPGLFAAEPRIICNTAFLGSRRSVMNSCYPTQMPPLALIIKRQRAIASLHFNSAALEDVYATIRRGRSGQGSLPCSTPLQSRAGTSPGSPYIRRLPPRPGVGSSNRR